jgi:protein SCO1/2
MNTHAEAQRRSGQAWNADLFAPLRLCVRLVSIPLFIISLLDAPTFAQRPAEVIQRVAFEQRLGEVIPLDAHFRDHTGQEVPLGDYFNGRPVILTLVYYECPMLCTLELNGLVRSLRMMDLAAGRDFDIVTVSFSPSETPELAARKRKAYLQQYGRRDAEAGWHFLTGEQPAIEKLCQAVGFRYVDNRESGQYAHASGIVVLTPEGRIARYFYGIDYPPRDLRLGLVEASNGKIGSAVDRLMLLCYGYDPATGKYGLVIMNIIRAAGAATVLAVAGSIVTAIYRERRRGRMHQP